MMRGTGLGDGGTGWDCGWRGDGEAAEDGEEEEVDEDGELGPRAMGRSCFAAATSIRGGGSRARARSRWALVPRRGGRDGVSDGSVRRREGVGIRRGGEVRGDV